MTAPAPARRSHAPARFADAQAMLRAKGIQPLRIERTRYRPGDTVFVGNAWFDVADDGALVKRGDA